jgi:hypothetical protein
VIDQWSRERLSVEPGLALTVASVAAGAHTFMWIYTNDSSYAEGSIRRGSIW